MPVNDTNRQYDATIRNRFQDGQRIEVFTM